jgi:hypothetical protein
LIEKTKTLIHRDIFSGTTELVSSSSSHLAGGVKKSEDTGQDNNEYDYYPDNTGNDVSYALL